VAVYAAHQVGLNIEALSFLPGVAFAQAATALVGQRVGAGDPEGARRTAGQALLVALGAHRRPARLASGAAAAALVFLAVLQPALRGDIDASNLYVTRTELHELLARSFDELAQRDSAAAHYQAVAKAWERADLLYHARRDSARTWLAQNSRIARQ